MSITAGYLALPSLGRWTSPTRFTPSLAGMVTSGNVVAAPACAGAATSSPAATARTAAMRVCPCSTASRVSRLRRRGAGCLGCAGFRLENRKRAATEAHAPWRHRAVDAEHGSPLVEEGEVDREAHPERVHRAAVRDQQCVVGRELSEERKTEQSRSDRG